MAQLLLMLLLGADSLLRQTFEEGTGGWTAIGNSSTLRITHDGVKNGSGALAFDYTVGDGVAVAALPAGRLDLSRMDGVRFWMKTDVPTALAVMLNEKKPGGDYMAICWSTGNTWQRVELTPSDFHLNTGPKDSPDPDGKLDLDAVQSIALLDISSIFGVKANADSPIAMTPHAGKHTLFIDDFELVAGAGAVAHDKAAIDLFPSPQLKWLTLGGAELMPENKGLRAVYEQTDEKSVMLVRQVAGADLRGRESLAFDIASDKPAQLLLGFEELAPGKQQGPRYNLVLEVPGGGRIDHREVLLSAFERGQDSPDDANGVLDLNQLKTFSILDITGTLTHENARNSLWIGNIRGVGDAPRP